MDPLPIPIPVEDDDGRGRPRSRLLKGKAWPWVLASVLVPLLALGGCTALILSSAGEMSSSSAGETPKPLPSEIFGIVANAYQDYTVAESFQHDREEDGGTDHFDVILQHRRYAFQLAVCFERYLRRSDGKWTDWKELHPAETDLFRSDGLWKLENPDGFIELFLENHAGEDVVCYGASLDPELEEWSCAYSVTSSGDVLPDTRMLYETYYIDRRTKEWRDTP